MEKWTTIKRFRPHPLYILGNLWRYLFLLLIPLLRGLYHVLINSFSLTKGFQLAVNLSAWWEGAWLDLLTLTGFLSLGILLWVSFTVDVLEDGLLVRRGVFRRETTFLPVSRYRCVSVVAPLRIRLFGAVYLRVDTPGGNLKNADLLVMLSRKDCQQLLQLLEAPRTLTPTTLVREYRPKSRYVFVLAMLTSNSFAGVLLISTFATQVGNLLGEQFSEMLYGTFETVARTLAFGVPPAAFALGCVLVFGYLCAFVASLSRHANFHVVRRGNLLEIDAGLLTYRDYRIEAEKIGYLDIRRSLLTCMLGVYSIFLSTVGYGKFKDDVSALIPCVRRQQLENSLRMLLPEYHLSQRTAGPNRLRSMFRYVWRTVALLSAAEASKILLSILFPGWVELISCVALMEQLPLAWMLAVKFIDLYTAGVSYEQGCYTLRYSKGFSLHQVIIRPERIVKVKQTQSIFQRRNGRCDVYVFSYSEGTQSHHIRDLRQEDFESLFGIGSALDDRKRKEK